MIPPTPDAVLTARIRVPARPPVPTADYEGRTDLSTGPRSHGIATASPELSVVVPLFDEQDTLPELYRRLTDALRRLGLSYELIFVDDGSRDATSVLLDAYATADAAVAALHFSRNFGHQPAISAGLDHARGSAVVVMDGDLQDPPELIPELVRRWRAGADVVYAIRTARPEGIVKRTAYSLFYRLFQAVSDLDVPLDAGDFCLMDRRAADALNRLPERTRFVRGLRAFIGFRQIGVPYERDPRLAGAPKYTLGKLVRLASDGLIGFSGFPIRAIGGLGLGLSVLAVATLAGTLAVGAEPRGWVILSGVVLLVGGLQLIAAGVIGEYVRRVFLEVAGRPPYIIRDVVRIQSGPLAPRAGELECR